jgi:UDP-2-acetamido-2,6-beta-L-arabino-hexul-4-ose reductase
MKVMVTGASGFLGKNLCVELQTREGVEVLPVDRQTSPSSFDSFCREAQFVFHLAGVNRPNDPSEFFEGNVGPTAKLVENLAKYGNSCPVAFSSSIHALSDTPYGRSKKAAEDVLLEHAHQTGAPVIIYRLTNVFGKWAKPNYNSVVATFCHNIARGLPIHITDREMALNLVYVDDVIAAFVKLLYEDLVGQTRYSEVEPVYSVTLGQVADLIKAFAAIRNERSVPNMLDSFTRKLYSTYLSYLPPDRFSYELTMHRDHRGSFTEFIRTQERGQVSINVLKPSVTKGNHWHRTKNEKFLVVSGQGVIRLRKIDSDRVHEIFVHDEKLEVVDIPPGYTHNIENLGTTDMVVVIWANEAFDPEQPDTVYLDV